jgi:vitamin B12 transporter
MNNISGRKCCNNVEKVKRVLFRLISFTSFGIIPIANLFAQIDSVKKDSIALIVDHKEYEVLAFHGYDFTAGIRTINIPSVLLKYNGSISNLSDALQSVGGIYMRSYGNGMNNGVTLRGFGPERTATLWNGIALNNAGLGQLDMNLMPGGLFNSIKLIEGSSSTQYGNGAQGGSLLLEYRPDFNNKFSMVLQQEYGSFFTWNTFAQFNYGGKSVQGRSAFIRSSANNNYAYRDKSVIGFPTKETENADFFSYQAMQDVFFRFKRDWHFSLHGWYTYTDRKTPPSMGAANNHSEQFDKNLRVMTQLRKSFEKHEIQFQVAYLNDILIFHTDAFKDSSQIHSGQVQIQYIWHPKNIFTLMSGGNFSVNYSEYKYYNLPVTESRGNVFVMANWEPKLQLSIPALAKLSFGVRQQFSSHYLAFPSAHAGGQFMFNLRKAGAIVLYGAVNTSYRMPTLNDLYWVPGGNVSLKPEYSWNTEVSAKYSRYTVRNIDDKILHTKFQLDAIGYFGRTSNWIQWTPTALGYWAPQNLTQVQSAGFEGGFEFSLEKKKWYFSIQSKYNFTSTLDVNNYFNQLIYVPEHTIKGNIQLKWNEIYLTVLPQFYSKRYTLSDESQSIPAFFLLNIQTGYTLKLSSCDIGFYCRLGNVTHQEYQMVANRPMPGLNFNAGINFNLHTITNKKQTK